MLHSTYLTQNLLWMRMRWKRCSGYLVYLNNTAECTKQHWILMKHFQAQVYLLNTLTDSFAQVLTINLSVIVFSGQIFSWLDTSTLYRHFLGFYGNTLLHFHPKVWHRHVFIYEMKGVNHISVDTFIPKPHTPRNFMILLKSNKRPSLSSKQPPTRPKSTRACTDKYQS